MRVLAPVAKTAPVVSVTAHGADVAAAADTVLRSQATKRTCDAVGIDWQALRRAGVTASLCHDSGKAVAEWQTRVANDRRPPNHSNVSAAVTAATAEHIITQLDGQPSEEMVAAATLAVLYHHTTMDGLWGGGGTMTRPAHGRVEQALTWLANTDVQTPSAAQHVCSTESVTIPDVPVSDPHRAVDELAKGVQRRVVSDDSALGVKMSLLRGALLQADRAVSARYEELGMRPDTGVEASPVSVFNPSDVLLHAGLRPFQQQLLTADATELVGKAGCGEGKTAAALAWAANRAAAGDADRVVFAMPTRTTANTLAASIRAEQGETGVQTTVRVYHSAASVEPFTDTGDRIEQRTGAVADADSAKWFQAPVTVTTVDHVLRSLLNSYPFAGIAQSNLLRSCVVFDEIHAYDDRLQACLGEAIEWLRQFDVPWLTLTATQPPPAEAVLPDTATTVTSVGCRNPTIPAAELTRTDPQPLSHKDTGDEAVSAPDQLPVTTVVDTARRHDVAADDDSPDSHSDTLSPSAYPPPSEEPRVTVTVSETTETDYGVPIQAVYEGAANPGVESILVVENTVTAARSLAQQLQTDAQFDVTYYSSEFANEHRDQKERAITDIFGVDNYPSLAAEDSVSVAVVTQVAELSLDLTADVLLTPVAPIDAIIQRAGRLHRDGTGTSSADCDCRQCRAHTTEHKYQVRIYADLHRENALYPYYEPGDETMFTRLARTVDALRAMDAVTMSAVETALDTVYDAQTGSDATDYARAVREDIIIGQPRQSGSGDETQLDIPIRDIESGYRTDVFPAVYTSLPGLIDDGVINESELPVPPEELWWRLHDCDEVADCGLFTVSEDERKTRSESCREAWLRFCRRWTVPVPSWWLPTDSDADIETRSVFSDELKTVGELPVSEIAYGYSSGVQPDTPVCDFHRPPWG